MEEVPVLIVGAGPSGATTALLLADLGIKSLVVSRHASTANTPRAHIFNQRAMEVLRDAGLETKLMSVSVAAHCKYPKSGALRKMLTFLPRPAARFVAGFAQRRGIWATLGLG